jgi:peptidoglycan/LPS O-acetylase OafA/YrhL
VTGGQAHANQQTPPRVLFAFAPGVLLAAVEVLLGDRVRSFARGRALGTASVLGGLVLLVVYAKHDRSDIAPHVLIGLAGTSLLVAGPLILQWTTGDAWRALDNGVMHWLGVRSYSIYLLHIPVLVALADLYTNGRGAWPAMALTAAVAVPITIGLATASYRFVEEPFLGLRTKRLIRSRPAEVSDGPGDDERPQAGRAAT